MIAAKEESNVAATLSGSITSDDDDEDELDEEECCLADEELEIEECYMGNDLNIIPPKVNFQSLTSNLTNNEHADDEIPDMPSWEEFQQQIEDYKNLSEMFEQLVVEGSRMENENEKYKTALNEKSVSLEKEKEKEIKTLKLQHGEATLREESLKEMLTEKDSEIRSLNAKLVDVTE